MVEKPHGSVSRERRVVLRWLWTPSPPSNPQVAKSRWIREDGPALEHGMLIAPLPADGEVGYCSHQGRVACQPMRG